MTDLLPCPFCGSKVHIEKHDHICWCVVHDDSDVESVENCPFNVLELPSAGSQEDVFKSWNIRKREPKKCCANCKHHERIPVVEHGDSHYKYRCGIQLFYVFADKPTNCEMWNGDYTWSL